MEAESIVYGCIKDSVWDVHSDEGKSRRAANRQVIEGLPVADGWAFLYQEMFSVPDDNIALGNYQTTVLHFGASYQAVEYEWQHWIEKFEAILKQLYWVSATVHLETEMNGIHTFSWDCNGAFHKPGPEPLVARCEWSSEGALA